MDSRVLESKQYEEFVKLSRAVKKYLKSELFPPYALEKKYEDAKRNYCEFLDDIGLKMPKSKFFFIHKDSSTHKYLSITEEKKIKDKTNLKFEKVRLKDHSIKIYLNPDFRY